MAVVKGNVIGNLSGKLGNLSARTRSGRTILSARPSSFNASQDPEIIANRQKFAVTVNFSKYVTSIPFLKSIWDMSTSQDISAMNAAVKNNYPYSSPEGPTVQNILTPGGFTLPVTSAEIDLNNVVVFLSALNEVSIIESYELNVSFASIIALFNPISEDDLPFSLITLSQDVDAFDFANPYNLNMTLHISEVNEMAKYSNNILFLAAATKDIDDKVLKYSKTFAQVS